MLDDKLEIYNTWLGGQLVVENKKITSLLDKQLSENRYIYPKNAYQTVNIPEKINFIPDIPNRKNFIINIIKTELPGIVTFKDSIKIDNKPNSWKEVLSLHDLCHLCVIERHGHNEEYAHGFIKNFNLKGGAVASSVGHDAHNIIVAGMDEDDMKLAVDLIYKYQGAVVIVKKGKLISKIELPIAGLMSDKKASEIAHDNKIFKENWANSGCTLAYMGFNLLPLSVIPNIRLTNKGLIDVNEMKIIPLFE